jgi:subtilase family serine protease
MQMAHGRIARLTVVVLILVFHPSSRIVGADLSPNVAYAQIRVNGPAQPTVTGIVPSQIRRAYGFDQITNQGAGQTIAIVEPYGHPRMEEDLAVFSQTFNLPPCTTANGCFKKISAGQNAGNKQVWALETALDVEWAHAIAPQANILLVEAKSDDINVLLDAIDVAVQEGADVVSISWGALETPGTSQDSHFVAANVTFIAGSGDFGTVTIYPAASPYVTGVGGTTLSLDAQGNYLGETAWSNSSGGLSIAETQPLYQAQFNIPFNPTGKRGIPDVAYHADWTNGFAVYSSVPFFGSKGWSQVAGTSAGAPQWAGLAAIVNSLRRAAGKPQMTGMNTALYNIAKTPPPSYGANYHDITSGTNGTCGAICTAIAGYDYVTGLGSPKANSLINALVNTP